MNRLALPILLLALIAAAPSKRRAVGPCEPYAETCRHCSDCSKCRHCSVNKGQCSVCAPKR